MTKIKELEIVLKSVRTTLQQCQAENKRLIKMGDFYANPENWSARGIAREDRGELARKTMNKIWGCGL